MNAKKQVRKAFRDAVFERDEHRCRVCCWSKLTFKLAVGELDAHHITDRHKMPHGGYVAENGISLCHECHVKAEAFHSIGTTAPGYSPDELYQLIGSSYALATIAAEKLGT